MTYRKEAIALVELELDKALAKFPTWPLDVVHASAIVAEEAGELVQASLDSVYRGQDIQKARQEAAQVACTALRFIMAIDAGNYALNKSAQV